MRLSMKVVLAFVLFASTCAEVEKTKGGPDWDHLERIARMVQSATAKKDSLVLSEALVEMLNGIPSSTGHYSLGVSIGETNAFYLNYAQHLTGATLSVPLNPFRRVQPECLYAPHFLEGPVVFYLGKDAASYRMCDIRDVYWANPVGFRPIASSRKVLEAVGENYKRKEGAKPMNEELALAAENAGYAYAIDPYSFEPEKLGTRKAAFVAGYAVEKDGFRSIVVKYQIDFYLSRGVRKAEVVLDEWDSCTQCEGNPRKFFH